MFNYRIILVAAIAVMIVGSCTAIIVSESGKEHPCVDAPPDHRNYCYRGVCVEADYGDWLDLCLSWVKAGV